MLTDDERINVFESAMRYHHGNLAASLAKVERAVLRKAAADFAARRFFVAKDGFLVETEPTLTVNDVATWLLEQAGGDKC